MLLLTANNYLTCFRGACCLQLLTANRSKQLFAVSNCEQLFCLFWPVCNSLTANSPKPQVWKFYAYFWNKVEAYTILFIFLINCLIHFKIFLWLGHWTLNPVFFGNYSIIYSRQTCNWCSNFNRTLFYLLLLFNLIFWLGLHTVRFGLVWKKNQTRPEIPVWKFFRPVKRPDRTRPDRSKTVWSGLVYGFFFFF